MYGGFLRKWCFVMVAGNGPATHTVQVIERKGADSDFDFA